jgi:hypothetical protein
MIGKEKRCGKRRGEETIIIRAFKRDLGIVLMLNICYFYKS